MAEAFVFLPFILLHVFCLKKHYTMSRSCLNVGPSSFDQRFVFGGCCSADPGPQFIATSGQHLLPCVCIFSEWLPPFPRPLVRFAGSKTGIFSAQVTTSITKLKRGTTVLRFGRTPKSHHPDLIQTDVGQTRSRDQRQVTRGVAWNIKPGHGLPLRLPRSP